VDSTADAADVLPGDGACAAATGECTLRAAVQESNATPGPDTINLPPGTYQLTLAGADEDGGTTGDLDIREALTIVGQGATSSIVDGGALDRVFHVRFASLELTAVTVRNGDVSATLWPFGGAILVEEGRLVVSRSDLTGCSASDGGAILLQGTGPVDLFRTVISECTASVTGGGISNGVLDPPGTIILTESAVADNEAALGGGVYNQGAQASLTATDSALRGNQVTEHGGGIYNFFGASAEISRCTLRDNIAGGFGGALANPGGADAIVTNSTFSGNIARDYGGGIANLSGGTVGLYNCTITDNSASNAGGGIGDRSPAPPDLILSHTIVALNNFPATSPDCDGEIGSSGYNLIGDTTGCTLLGDLTGNITGTDPVLGPLRDNGGPTLTHALLVGSPALEAGDPAGCLGPAGAPLVVDQRGILRPQDWDGDLVPICDIGAYEGEGACTPDEPTQLVVSKPRGNNNPLDLAWAPVTAGSYNVYRGTLSVFASAAYDHGDVGLCALSAESAQIPRGRDSNYYLVVSRCGPLEGSYGRASSGVERDPANPLCP
jgi:hypothetical protein